MAPTRDIIIGDVHGCAKELKKLLKKVEADPEKDRIWFVGDLINKGPDSRRTMKLFRKTGGRAVKGNHECRLIDQYDKVIPRGRLYSDMKAAFGDKLPELVEEIRSWPLWIKTDDFLLIHAGMAPGMRLKKQPAEWLTNIRTWDGTGKNLNRPGADPAWFECVNYDRLIVFGHWAQLQGVDRNNVIGLDTGCVYGGKLSALILPERKIVSVKAAATYSPV